MGINFLIFIIQEKNNFFNKITNSNDGTEEVEFVNQSNSLDKTINFLSPIHIENYKRLTPMLNFAPKKSKTVNESYLNSTERTIEDFREISSKLNEKPEENEFEFFGKTIACMLKKLPEIIALESMAHIQSYLVQKRLEAIGNQNHQESSMNESLTFSSSS
jgi:hypothetical protein